MSVAARPPAFHVMAKPSGAACNLDCKYCYFLAKERLYPGSRFRMSEEVLEAYLQQLFAAHGPGEVTIAWQGGEPTLMGLEFFRRAVALAERHRRPGQIPRHAFQTNGILLDDRWAAFLKEHDFLVGVSVDGPRALHDAYRVDKGGRPTFDRVMRGLAHLQRHGVAVNILCAVHAANGNRPREVYRFLRDDLEARFIQFIPIVERDDAPGGREGGCVTARSVGARQYGAVFEAWVRQDVGRVFVQTFDVALASWLGEPEGLCVHAPTCGLGLALEHNGDLYSCDHFVEPEHLLGNILDQPMSELVVTPRQRDFGRAKVDRLPRRCRACDVRFACHGGCPKDRFLTTGEGEPGLNYLCAGYRAFFRHIDPAMRLMAALIARGRAPREIMQLGAGEPRRGAGAARPRTPGRNSPCPCGSGRKFKHCHGRSVPPRP